MVQGHLSSHVHEDMDMCASIPQHPGVLSMRFVYEHGSIPLIGDSKVSTYSYYVYMQEFYETAHTVTYLPKGKTRSTTM